MKKLVFSSIVLIFVTFGWSGISLGGQPPAPRGELRVVERSHRNFVSIVLNVFEHLIDANQDGTLEPRLATGWRWLDDRTLEFTLRQGVKFHNGEIFDADIVKLNWDENLQLKQPFASGSYMNFKPGSRLEIIDPYTVRFHFPEPDGVVMGKLERLLMANRQFYQEIGGWGEKGW